MHGWHLRVAFLGSDLEKAENCANDLVDPDTLDRLKEIILEKPEIEEGFDW